MNTVFTLFLTLTLVVSTGVAKPIDATLEKEADAVARVNVVQFIGGSKYHLSEVELIDIYKNETEQKIEKKFRVAYYSFGSGLPLGEVTIYMKEYNRSQKNSGWALVENSSEKSSGYTPGFSHSKNSTDANQAGEATSANAPVASL